MIVKDMLISGSIDSDGHMRLLRRVLTRKVLDLNIIMTKSTSVLLYKRETWFYTCCKARD